MYYPQKFSLYKHNVLAEKKNCSEYGYGYAVLSEGEEMQRSVRRRRPAGSCEALSHAVSYFLVAYMFASFSIKPQLVVAHRPVLFFPFCFS